MNDMERPRRARRLSKGEIRLGTLVAEASPDGILALGPDRRVIFINGRFAELWGLPPDCVASGDDDTRLLAQAAARVVDPAAFLARVEYLHAHPAESACDQVALRCERYLDCYSLPLGAPGGEHLGRVWFFRDISQRKAAERAVRRLDRVRAVLYETRSAILRAGNRAELYREACRIAVEQGRLRLAWIGLLDDSGELQPAAVSGAGRGSALPASSQTELAHGRGPGSRALRERQAQVCNDIAAEGAPAERDQALALGLRSFIAQPLLVEGRAIGALLLYSGEAGFFDDEELKLLERLAADIAHGIELLTHREQLDYLAHYDLLTGLANRVRFGKRLQEMLEGARAGHRGLAVLVLDLERFRSVTGIYGTAAGDHVLREVTARLLSVAGPASCVARIGGDVFAIAAPQVASAADCAKLRDMLCARLGEPIALGKEPLRMSARIGMALFPGDADGAETLFRNAEAALKAAKAAGRRYLAYTSDISHGLRHKLGLESQLRNAVEREQLVLHYQPKIDLRNRSISGCEALLRWDSPDQGLVPPGRFVPLLEETGLIVEVGRWVMQRAVADQCRWREAGLRIPRVAINLSALQLHQPDFLETLRAALAGASGSSPELDIEVTESMLIADVDASIGKLREVRDMGVSIAVDDFGVGYSSLAYLTRLPVDAVKIDRSFVIKMVDNADALDIVSAIISLGRSIGLKVIAEGVDSEEQLKLLRLLRCNEAQGFLFSQGLAAEPFAALLRGGTV